MKIPAIILIILIFMISLSFSSLRIVKPQQNVIKNNEDVLIAKLSKIKNSYKIKENINFIEKAYAQAPYDGAISYAAVDYDTGEVILSKNLHKKLPIASLTKVISAVVSEDLAYDSTFVVKRGATQITPTRIGVIFGEKMKVSELIESALLTSANDATQVLSDGIDNKYGAGTFVSAMNKKSKIIGLFNSHFSNPQGFDDKDNYSTVADLAILSQYALKHYPLISETAKKDYKFLPEDKNHKQFDLYNWNGLLKVYPGTLGLKIGNTNDAGHTTIVISKRENKKIIAIILGAPGILERDLWASSLLNDAFLSSENLSPINVTQKDLLAKYATWKYWN